MSDYLLDLLYWCLDNARILLILLFLSAGVWGARRWGLWSKVKPVLRQAPTQFMAGIRGLYVSYRERRTNTEMESLKQKNQRLAEELAIARAGSQERSTMSTPPLPESRKKITGGFAGMTLLQGEELLHIGRLHPIIFLPPIAFAGIAAYFIYRAAVDLQPLGVIVVIVICIVLSVVFGLDSCIRYISNEFSVTTKRVLVKTGFISRRSLEFRLHKVEGISIEQGVLGRILDYGNITVVGAGGSKERFTLIANPMKCRQEVLAQMDRLGV